MAGDSDREQAASHAQRRTADPLPSEVRVRFACDKRRGSEGGPAVHGGLQDAQVGGLLAFLSSFPELTAGRVDLSGDRDCRAIGASTSAMAVAVSIAREFCDCARQFSNGRSFGVASGV